MSAANSLEQRPLRDTVADAFRLVVRRVNAAVLAIYRSVEPTEEGAWLTEAQLRLYRRSTLYSSRLLPVGGFLVAEATSDWIAPLTRLTWWLCLLVVSIGSDIIGTRLEALDHKSLANVRLRARAYVAMSSLTLLVWCSMSIFLWAPNVTLDHMLLVLILACSLAGSIAINSVHPGSAAVGFVLHGVFIVGPLAFSHAPLDGTMAWLAAVYVIILAGQVYGLNVSTTKMLTLEHEREGLVEGLRLAKQDSDRDRARAASAGRAKSQFLSNMNHELRTPMNAILGFSELIKNKSFGSNIDKYAEYAGIIHDSGQHLLGLIDDVLNLAKIESGKLGLRESEVNLAELIGDAVHTSEETARGARISLSKSIGPGVPHVWGDERALRQIFANLLSNAIKFTPSGGCIVVFARYERSRDSRVAFGVEDTGIGIAEEDRADAFERFGGSRHDVTTADRGTGIGLAIVKGFVEAHDGEVALESTLGAGTRVTVYLPAERIREYEPVYSLAG